MEKTIEIPFSTVMKSLNKCFVMPCKDDSTKFMCVSLFLKVASLFFFVIGGFMHLTKIMRENIEEIDASEDIVVISAGLGTIFILGFTTYVHKEWENFLENVMDFSYGKPKKIDEQIKFGNFWGKYLGYYYIGGCFVYGAFSILDASNCNKINEERDLHLICDTFVPIWLPFDVPNKNYRYVIFLIQLALVIMSVNPAAMVCFLTYEATEIIGLHIENLNDHFRKIISKKDVKCRSDGIGYWVRYHNRILKLADTLRILVKRSVGHLTMISALVFGCSETQLVKGVKPLGALIFFVGWMVALLLLCHAGERLMNFSLSVHDAVRDSDWYKASPAIQRDVVFILMRSQKPLYLDALPLGAMNYSLFVLMLRTSYSYMTLLNQSV